MIAGNRFKVLFKKYISNNPKETFMIGNRVRPELEIGKNLGTTTIWVKQGKFASEEPLTKD